MTSTGPMASPSRRTSRNSTSPDSGYARGDGFGFEEGRPAPRPCLQGRRRQETHQDSRVLAVIDPRFRMDCASTPRVCCGSRPATASTATRRRAKGSARSWCRRRSPISPSAVSANRACSSAPRPRSTPSRRREPARNGRKKMAAQGRPSLGGENEGGEAPGKGGTKRQLTFSRTRPARVVAFTTMLVMISPMPGGPP